MQEMSLTVSEFQAQCSVIYDEVQEVKLTMKLHPKKKIQGAQLYLNSTSKPVCYSDPDINDFNKHKETPQIEDIVEELSKIQDIYKFDPGILREDPQRTLPSNWNKANTKRLLQLKDFYSVLERVRNKAFEDLIKKPLLNVITNLGHFCSKLSGNAKKIAQFSYLQTPDVKAHDDGLCKIALQEMFSDPTNGLSALRCAIEALQKDPKSFSDDQLNSLSLFRSLAGFYFDRMAVQRFIELSDFIEQSDPSDRIVRLAILMFLQVAGEYFDRLLPGTLGFAKDIPDTVGNHLRKLRNNLSHVSQSKLEKVLQASLETQEQFKKVQQDIKRLRASLQRIQSHYKDMSNSSNANLWSRVKELAHKGPSAKASWNGFLDLSNSLEHVKDKQLAEQGNQRAGKGGQRAGGLLFDIESGVFYSSTRDLVMVKDYFKQREALMGVMNDEKLAEKTPESFLKDLKKVARGISAKSLLTKLRCDTLLQSLKMIVNEKKQFFKDEMSEEGTKKLDELKMIKNKFIDELLSVSSDDHQKIEERKEQLATAKEKLRQLLDSEHQKACSGYGNISEKYKDFCEMLSAVISLPNDNTQFSWTSEPTSNLEKLFHKVHKTGIFTKAGKDALRRTRILQMLTTVDYLQEMVGIKADIALDIKKTLQKKIMESKAELMEDAIFSLSNQPDEIEKLRDPQKQFSSMMEHLVHRDTVSDVEQLIREAEAHRNLFIKILAAIPTDQLAPSVDIKSLMKGLEDTSRDECYYDLEYHREVMRVKDVDRNHPSVVENAKKIKDFFKTYAETSGKTVQQYAQHMEDALQSIDDYQKEKQQLHTLYDKFLGIAKQLLKVDTTEEAKSLIDEAIKTQYDFDKQLESMKSDHWYTFIYLSVRDTCKEKLTALFQEYHNTILAYQFVVATIYDMLSQIFDYPELYMLRAVIEVRHHYFHCILVDKTPLVVINGRTVECNRPNTREGQLANDISYLTIVVKFYLNNLAHCLRTK